MTIPTLLVVVLCLSLCLVNGLMPVYCVAGPDGRVQTARYVQHNDHHRSQSNNNDGNDEGNDWAAAPPPMTTTGDVLLDRRLALVRTVALAASGTVTAATMATSSSSSSSSSSFLLQTPPPANAVGRAEILINAIQSRPEIVAARNTQGDPTKHTPVVTLEKDAKGYGQILTVEVPHVMDFEKPHYIQYLWLQDVTTNPNDVRLGNIIAAQAYAPSLKVGGKTSVKKSPITLARISTKVASGRLPTKAAYLTKGMIVKPCLYCNLHGLWEGDPISLG